MHKCVTHPVILGEHLKGKVLLAFQLFHADEPQLWLEAWLHAHLSSSAGEVL